VSRENELAKIAVDAAFRIHTTLGPGLLESVYRLALPYDLVVEDCLILETKSVERQAPVHKKQLLTYLRLMDKRLGLLINFGSNLLKDGVTRIANGMPD